MLATTDEEVRLGTRPGGLDAMVFRLESEEWPWT